MDLRRIRRARHHLTPGHGEAGVESVEGEEELLGERLPVTGVEEDDEVLAEVLGQAVGRLTRLVYTRDVPWRAGS